MKAQLHEYRGWVAIVGDKKLDGLLNDPTAPGQLGFVLDAKEVEASEEALEVLRKVKRSGDDIGEVDVYRQDNGKVILSWLGGPRRPINPEIHTGSNSYDATLLDGVVTIIPNSPPDDFTAFVRKAQTTIPVK